MKYFGLCFRQASNSWTASAYRFMSDRMDPRLFRTVGSFGRKNRAS